MQRIGLVALCATFAIGAGAQQPLTIPPPRGMLSDFATVVAADRASQIEALAQFVRDRSGGEIALVTLPDLAGRDVGEVALQIGREWKVGAKAAVGDARRNAGIVVLVVPKETSADGRGHIRIEVGQGAEGFIPDAAAGDIQREAIPYLQRRDYGGALLLITLRLSERYAAEFGFSLDSAGVPGVSSVARRGRAQGEPQGINPIFAAILFIVAIAFIMGGRGRRSGCLGFLIGQAIGQAMGRRGRWGGGGGFGGGFGGGGGGGGFGGFGGGGGFSGGGSSGSW